MSEVDSNLLLWILETVDAVDAGEVKLQVRMTPPIISCIMQQFLEITCSHDTRASATRERRRREIPTQYPFRLRTAPKENAGLQTKIAHTDLSDGWLEAEKSFHDAHGCRIVYLCAQTDPHVSPPSNFRYRNQ